ncbi:MAG: thermonuclease family protein [SAR324 cluster bacterium]|nr:thermonuclease family protein [SAR324 cluster bacterium]
MKIPLSFLVFFLLWNAICGNSFAVGQAIPHQWIRIPATYLNKHIIDGDTFDIDLNKNKRFEKSRERIRLLYVDTPELSESHKGKNLKFGLPAKRFLHRVLHSQQIYLWIDPKNRYDKFGRILAIVEVMQRNINLELIQLGYSYFDTRFSLPAAYQTYADRESEAFSKYRGIWSTALSRESYLKRLQKEGKTVRSEENDLFFSKTLAAKSLDLEKFLNRFIMTTGRIHKITSPRRKLDLVFLQNSHDSSGLRIVLSERRKELLQLGHLKIGDHVYVEGFVSLYRNSPQIVIHRGYLLNPSRSNY